MSALIVFHRAMFAGMLITAFFLGALDAGRRDVIRRMSVTDMLELSLTDLQSADITMIKVVNL